MNIKFNYIKLEVSRDASFQYDLSKLKDIQTLFLENVKNFPESEALAFKGRSVSYSELHNSALRVASFLQSKGIKKGDKISLLMERSPEMVSVILGITLIGSVYVPLDPSDPELRIKYILEETQAKIIFLDSQYSVKVKEFEERTVVINTDLFKIQLSKTELPKIDSSDPIYIMYTSGSTGKPKGVIVTHAGVARLVKNNNFAKLDSDLRIGHLAPISFDASTLELWGPLLNGGTCVLYPGILPTPNELKKFLTENNVTTLWLTASLFNLIIEEDPKCLATIKELLIGGEALSVKHVIEAYKYLPNTQIINGYGPTENTTFTCTFKIPKNISRDLSSIPLGKTINGTTAYILNEDFSLTQPGEEGELCVGGAGVSKGYLNDAKKTEEKFFYVKFEDGSIDWVYKTGDIVKVLASGDFEFKGRKDSQVKINGHRIELGEIEAHIRSHNNIAECAVICDVDSSGSKKLVAFLKFNTKEDNLIDISDFLKDKLPSYMIPDHIIILTEFPKTSSGKIDRQRLRNTKTKDVSSNKNKESIEISEKLEAVWCKVLEKDSIAHDQKFFDIGGKSLQAVRVVSILSREYGIELPITTFFEFPTIESQALYLSDSKKKISFEVIENKKEKETDIAIIGMAGRFPGSENVDVFWEDLCNGKEGITYFDSEELDKSILNSEKTDPNYVKARGILKGIDLFDNTFFKIPALEAEILDPQSRILLEVCWEALERAGYTPDIYNERIGIFAGMYNSSYFLKHVQSRPDLIKRFGEFQTMLAHEKDYVATRIAYKLNLKGPAISIHTACSTSLVAIHTAVQALRSGQTEIALAGGVSITCPPKSGYLYTDGGMLSPDGHTRTFSENAQGTTFSDGVGVVVLKRLDKALEDSDKVYAVIAGSAVNNDGGSKVSFTAPSIEGQANVVYEAIKDASVTPSDISYIEAHGTATPIGDPIEVEALNRVFAGLPADSIKLGSVKSNVGHLVIAAGVTGIIKTALSLSNEKIPPTINFSKPNKDLNIDKTPFKINNVATSWKRSEKVRYAGVSSFGVGGTNAHVIVKEPPLVKSDTSKRSSEIFIVSGKSKDAAEKSLNNIKNFLALNKDINLADVSFTLAKGRSFFDSRSYIIFDGKNQLNSTVSSKNSTSKKIGFLFPGQGSQAKCMGKELYNTSTIYQSKINECSEIILEFTGNDIRTKLFNADLDDKDLRETEFTQPALFVTEYALASMLIDLGIKPEVLVGHSVGEFVAATLAGIFSLKDALKIVIERAKLMQHMPTGSMLAVRESYEEIAQYLTEDTSLAADNAPKLCVVSGKTESIEKLEELLSEKNISTKRLYTSHAFHSSMMEEILQPLVNIIESCILNSPTTKIISTVTGELLSDLEAKDPKYWAKQARVPVQFKKALRNASNFIDVFVESGPRSSLTAFAKQTIKDCTSLPVLSDFDIEKFEWRGVQKVLGELWIRGINVNWNKYFKNEKRVRVALPTYPFERKSFWVEPHTSESSEKVINQNMSSSTQTLTIKKNPMDKKNSVVKDVLEVLELSSGITVESSELERTFFELGLDSLFMTQFAQALQEKFNVSISFRELTEELISPDKLSDYLVSKIPDTQHTSKNFEVLPRHSHDGATSEGESLLENTIAKQLQLMQQQLDLLRSSSATSVSEISPTAKNEEKVSTEQKTIEEAPAKSIGPMTKISLSLQAFNERQKKAFLNFSTRYIKKTQKSKELSQQHRRYFADPRTVSGFTPDTKEIVYPIYINRSKGSRFWDVDGNEYIDLTNGFGSNFLGHSSDIIVEALKQQLDRGYEVGPIHPLSGEVAKLVTEMTGYDRATFASTGSESVLGALRVARTVTGRKLVVIFSGGYHGIFDEVIVKGTKKLRTLPAAPGIPSGAVENILVLDWGHPDSLKIIRERAGEIAAVMVEPVQSRKPEIQPKDFILEIRRITEQHGAALIFDEIVTGFRLHPKGAQGFYDIKADMSTYGKVVGGGLPIGIICGVSSFMDAFDGGYWQYGDESKPEVGVTYFAGTFVRNPLALAASKTILEYIQGKGDELYLKLNNLTEKLVFELNTIFKQYKVPLEIGVCGSVFKIHTTKDFIHTELIYAFLREQGIHIWDGRPCFLTESHTEEDVKEIIRIFTSVIKEMVKGELLPTEQPIIDIANNNEPPVEGARLGRDPNGNPAWFISDPNRPGKYIKVEDIQ